MLKVIDLFSGVGGLSLGFERTGFEIILANEKDPSIAKAYKKNFPKTKVIVGDITELPISKTFGPFKGQIDVIIGGPPCQGFSQKGQRKTINDDRNFLFKYYASVVKEISPKYFVMENVPNLLTAEHGYFKEEIIKIFSGLGYTVNTKVLNASDYGVPQDRRRAFIIGKKNSFSPVDFPEPCLSKENIWDAISDLAFLESGEGEFVQDYLLPARSVYQEKLRRGSKKLFNHEVTRHSKIALERLAMIPPKGGKEYLPTEHLTRSIYSGTWERMNADDQSVTITTRFDTPSSGKFTHPYLDRAITVREAARIQSFPDDFIFYGTKSSQMKQVGNAVPPLLAEAIAKTILNDIKKEETQ